MSTMAMVPCGVTGDWGHVLEDFNMLCSSSSSPLAMASTRAEDCLPIAAAPPARFESGKNELLLEASSDGAFAAADCLSSALMNIRAEDESFYLPMYSAPPALVGDQYCSYRLPPLPADGATASLDDALLLPFSDIDLEAFGNAAAHEHKPTLIDPTMIPPAAAAGHNPAGAQAPIHHDTAIDQNACAYADQKPMSIEYYGFRPGASGGVEMDAVNHHEAYRRQARSTAALVTPPPQLPSLPRPRGRRTAAGDRPAAAPAGKTRLDHIGFDELRKYFYMPITRAAREMNVGLTVLKKRCRELGVARWPHRKMKSLKSLIVNVQEMGNGLSSPVGVQQELAALETYCTLMEENPWIELTERTKKLRQACFKESYKRRRAAAVNVVEMDHRVYSFGQHHHLPPPPTGSAADRHGQSGSRFFGF